jgi:hypothetical protein
VAGAGFKLAPALLQNEAGKKSFSEHADAEKNICFRECPFAASE